MRLEGIELLARGAQLKERFCALLLEDRAISPQAQEQLDSFGFSPGNRDLLAVIRKLRGTTPPRSFSNRPYLSHELGVAAYGSVLAATYDAQTQRDTVRDSLLHDLIEEPPIGYSAERVAALSQLLYPQFGDVFERSVLFTDPYDYIEPGILLNDGEIQYAKRLVIRENRTRSAALTLLADNLDNLLDRKQFQFSDATHAVAKALFTASMTKQIVPEIYDEYVSALGVIVRQHRIPTDAIARAMGVYDAALSNPSSRHALANAEHHKKYADRLTREVSDKVVAEITTLLLADM